MASSHGARTDAFLREQERIPGPDEGEVKRGSREDEASEASQDDLAEGSSQGEGKQA